MKEITKKEDKRKENAYDIWSREAETAFHLSEYHQDSLEDSTIVSHTVANDDEHAIDGRLAALETQSKLFFDFLKESVAEEDANLTLPALDVPQEDSGVSPAFPSATPHRPSPVWLVAAVLLGFVIGFLMPRGNGFTAFHSFSLIAADSSVCCRSLAEGDVNTTLLVSL